MELTQRLCIKLCTLYVLREPDLSNEWVLSHPGLSIFKNLVLIHPGLIHVKTDDQGLRQDIIESDIFKVSHKK